MIYATRLNPQGEFIEPNVQGTVLLSRGAHLPPVFSLAPARIESRIALKVPTIAGDQVVFPNLPAKYELHSFRGYDAQFAIVSCSIELRTAPHGAGLVVSILDAGGMHPLQRSKLGTVPETPMLTQSDLYVFVADPSSKPNSLTLLLQVLNLTPGELSITPGAEDV